MTLLTPALRLADRGWQMFALNPGGLPWPNCNDCSLTCGIAEDYEACPHLLCHAAYAGTTAGIKLDQMFEDHPDSLLGLRTGIGSGLFVLDFDMHEGGKNGIETLVKMKEAGVLPLTVTALTGGGGVHLYYRHPGGDLRVPNDNRGKVGPGVDVKGDGGYVIVPPSQKTNKPNGYRWYDGRSPWQYEIADLPSSLLVVISRVKEVIRRYPAPAINVDFSLLTTKALGEALDRLEFEMVGGRNARLYEAACRAGEAVAAGAIDLEEVKGMLEARGMAAGLSGNEINGTVRSGLRRGMHDFQLEVSS